MAHNKDGSWAGLGFDQINGQADSGPEVEKVQRRLRYAYSTNSKAIQNGLQVTGVWDKATNQSVIDMCTWLNANEGTNYRIDGIASAAFRTRIKAYIPAPPAPKPSKYPIQGVGYDTRAYLMPPDAPSFNKDCAQAAREGQNLWLGYVPESVLKPHHNVIGIGYSMGSKALREFEMTLTPEQRLKYKLSINFGDPSMRPDGSLLGDTPGKGISLDFHPDFVKDIYYSYSLDGDWYPRARGLLFFFYQIISRAELTLDFAQWLFTQFPMMAMQQLMGQEPISSGDDPSGLFGILSPLAGLMTSGPQAVVGQLFDPLKILSLLPQIIWLLTDALKFAMSNAHGLYGDPAHAEFEGLTGVDHAVKTIRERCPEGATLLLFCGSWASWDQGFPMDVARQLQPA